MRENRLSRRTKQPYGGTGRYKPAALLSNPRDDVGIVPYAKGKVLPFNRAWPNILGVPSTPAACGRHPLQAGEGRGFPAVEAFPYLPLGEGAAAAAEEGRYQVGSACRPTPVRAFGPATLSRERV